MVSYRGKFSRYAAMGGFLRLQPHFACRSFLILRFLNGGGRLYLVYFRPSSLKFLSCGCSTPLMRWCRRKRSFTLRGPVPTWHYSGPGGLAAGLSSPLAQAECF